MNREVIITCALTGTGDTIEKNPNVPITPEQIAKSAVKACDAGAAIAHIHVRDPKTGKWAHDLELYKESARLIRECGKDIILNISAGMGADFIPDHDNPGIGGPGTYSIPIHDRVHHIEVIKPDITTLDCGSMNYTGSAYIATMDQLRETSRRLQATGVRIEAEVFELGHIWQAKQLMAEGLLDKDSIFNLCMGVPYTAEATTLNVITMRNSLPEGAIFGGFGVGNMQLPMVAQMVLAGGNVRVGLEDNIWLKKGVPATNEQLVEAARTIIETMGSRILSVAEARKKLKITI
ncbi:MAG: 3-keto-5-aminohexanoate cleavage protein [Brevinema sp.]